MPKDSSEITLDSRTIHYGELRLVSSPIHAPNMSRRPYL